MRIVPIQQRTPEWLAWRGQGIGASDAPIILGRSPWLTPQELWEMKRGLREPPKVNPMIQRGIDHEHEALEYFEGLMGEIFSPMCVEHEEAPFIRGSFDGIDITLSVGIEIKVPSPKWHKAALEGVVPRHYEPQLQHFYMLGVSKMFYGSYSPETKSGVLLEVPRDDQLIDELWKAENEFWKHVKSGEPMYSPDWAEAAAMWLAAEEEYQSAKQAKEAATQRLRDLHPEGVKTFKGAGVTATLWKKAVDVEWDRVVSHLQGRGVKITMADVDSLRKPGPVDEAAFLSKYGLAEEDLLPFRVYSPEVYTVKRAK